jgi:predicted Ser/Thr protein kinase
MAGNNGGSLFVGGSEDKDKGLKTPPEVGQQTTPYRTPGAADAETELGFPTPLLGALKERYELLGELGRGGMGIVYRARDRETDEVVALKVLQPEIASRPDLIERFKAELRLARKITHKNVCRTYELLRFGDTVVITMEYVEGESLRHFLDRLGGAPLRRGVKWVEQICSALGEAHQQGVVHRDLKPENVLITRDGAAKVMDFGIARSLETGTNLTTGTETGAFIGTPAYMSPEQAEGKPADPRSDIYSLGLLMYEMFTGRQAFHAETPVAMAVKHVHETPPPPREIEPLLPPVFDRVIRKCLEKNPKNRFQSASEVPAAITQKAEIVFVAAAAQEKVAEAPLPLHLATWQRSDTFLFLAALVAAVVFFPLFDRLYPYNAASLTVARDAAVTQALSVVQRFDPSASLDTARYKFPDAAEFFHQEALALGPFAVDRRVFEQESGWQVSFHGAADSRITGGGPGVTLSATGRLLSLHVPQRSPGKEPLPARDLLQQQAAEYATELFQVKLDDIEPASTVGSREDTFMWRLPTNEPGVERHLLFWFTSTGLQAASDSWVQEYGSPPEASRRTAAMRQILLPFELSALGIMVFVLLALFILFLFITRLREKQTNLRAFWGAALATLAVLAPAVLSQELHWAVVPAAGILTLLFLYAILYVADYYLTRSDSHHAASLQAFNREGLKAQSAGLAILRGCGLGLAYLLLHISLLALLGWMGLAAPSLFWLLASPASVVSSTLIDIYAVSLAFLISLLVSACVVAFPAALARRIGSRPALLVGLPATVWFLTISTLPGASVVPVVPFLVLAALQALIFSFLYYRYDFLTVLLAIFTVETWLLIYPGYALLHRIAWTRTLLEMLPWFLLLFLGAAVYFRPQLVGGWRRVAEVFE